MGAVTVAARAGRVPRDALRKFNSGPDCGSSPDRLCWPDRWIRDPDRCCCSRCQPICGRCRPGQGRRQAGEGAWRGWFRRLVGILPPPTRRAVILIDPPYEVKADYRRVEGPERSAQAIPQAPTCSGIRCCAVMKCR